MKISLKNIIYKKLNASSLTEVLVATVLLLLVFGIAMTTLNNVLYGSITRNTHKIETTLNQLVYQYQHKQIKVPLNMEQGQWQISINKENSSELVFKASHNTNKKVIYKKLVNNEVE